MRFCLIKDLANVAELIDHLGDIVSTQEIQAGTLVQLGVGRRSLGLGLIDCVDQRSHVDSGRKVGNVVRP